MPTVADRVTAQLQVLVGQPVGDCWRAADMIIFEFGPRRRTANKRGEPVEVSEMSLHIQCPWRIVSPSTLHFGRADVHIPLPATTGSAPASTNGDTRLDRLRRAWNDARPDDLLSVRTATGDPYGGFRLELSGGFALETFPTTTAPDSEHWRLLRADGTHFIVSGGDAHLVPPEPGA